MKIWTWVKSLHDGFHNCWYPYINCAEWKFHEIIRKHLKRTATYCVKLWPITRIGCTTGTLKQNLNESNGFTKDLHPQKRHGRNYLPENWKIRGMLLIEYILLRNKPTRRPGTTPMGLLAYTGFFSYVVWLTSRADASECRDGLRKSPEAELEKPGSGSREYLIRERARSPKYGFK